MAKRRIAGAASPVYIEVVVEASGVASDVNVTDRAARELGQADLRVGGAAVSATNPMPVEARPRCDWPPHTDTQAAAQTDTTLWDPAAGKRIVLTGVLVSSDAVQTILFEVGAVEAVPMIFLGENGSGNILFDPPIPLPVNGILTYTSANATNHSVAAYGWEE